MENKKVVKVNTVCGKYGMYIEIVEENGDVFSISDIPDDFLIKILKDKGYKITKEF